MKKRKLLWMTLRLMSLIFFIKSTLNIKQTPVLLTEVRAVVKKAVVVSVDQRLRTKRQEQRLIDVRFSHVSRQRRVHEWPHLTETRHIGTRTVLHVSVGALYTKWIIVWLCRIYYISNIIYITLQGKMPESKTRITDFTVLGIKSSL